MKEKLNKSGAKSIIMNNNNCSFELNRSVANSIITSSYIILKDGTKKRKRHVNSYMEEFLEKRRLAAEFAQSKRSTSSKNPRIKIDKNINNNNSLNCNINIKKIEEAISINNLKNNLPGKTTALIDNVNYNNNDIILDNRNDKEIDINKYITIPNEEENVSYTKNLIINNQNINNNYYINKQNNYNYNIPKRTNEDLEKKYNNIKRHNIVYTKKKGQNVNNNILKNTSNHSFTENRYSSINNDNDNDNEEQNNIINNNELNTSNNKELELLGPQSPEDAFIKNNIDNKIAINNIHNNYKDLNLGDDLVNMKKDNKNINNFNDISPIKPKNTIEIENNNEQLNNNNDNGNDKIKDNDQNKNLNIGNMNNSKINKSDHFITLMQKMINNKENDNEPFLQNNKVINKSTNFINNNNNEENILNKNKLLSKK